jgi:flagellar hook-associated protein 3
MRVTHNTIYNVAQSRLGSLVEKLGDANRQVTTGNRINRLSDDPVGISRVVDLRSGIDNIEQLSENIATARNWLSSAETSLGTIGDLMDDMKVLVIGMRNDSYTAEDRTNAAAQVRETLSQVLDLTNTQVNGQYIFSGTKVDTKPYAFDDPDAPTMVSYSGNDSAFKVKTGNTSNTVVGYSGEDIFGSDYLTVDDTNNKIDFQEVVGGVPSPELTATIPHGTYTRDELATAIENALTNASAPGNGVTYEVTYNDTSGLYTLWDDGGATTLDSLDLLWGSGANADQSIAPDIGFEPLDETDTMAIDSDQSVQWGLFNTLFDLKGYLENNDVAGIERSFARIDTQFENMTNAVSRIGYKGVALDAKTTVLTDLDLSFQTQKSDIEEVDIIEAISSLQAKQTAYQAALASTAQIMNISLMNYL